MNFKNILPTITLLFIGINVFAQFNTKVVLTEIDNKQLKLKMEQNSSKFLTAINKSFNKKSKPNVPNGILSTEAITSLYSMWEMSKFRCYEADVIERILNKPSGGYEVRNVPVFMNEAPKEDQYQELVLVFNNSGTIDNIYISMESNRYTKIMEQGKDVKEFTRRQIIIDFVENFRTAYNRKDINFLAKVFSEDALIISGKVIKVKPMPIDNGVLQGQMSTEKITYQKQTKTEYISKMKRIFAKNSYMNIKFSEIEVKRHGKYPDIYGVNLKQNWGSALYSDVGYLFLMIDFSDDNNPLIHVRTWQPEKIGEKILTDDEKFQLEMFNPQK